MPSGRKADSSSKLSDKQLLSMAHAVGVESARLIDPGTVETGEWVRLKCQFGCQGFGKCLTCPPNSPTPSQTRAMLDQYSKGILFEIGQDKSRRVAADLERQIFLQGYHKAFAMSSGPCDLCDDCGMSQGCRHSALARPAMEACGIDVYATVRKHGFAIDVLRGAKDPQHNFALVLVE